MKAIFWGAVAVIGYSYFGYPAWLWVRSRLRPRPIRRAPFFPRVSVVVVVRNEEKVLPAKLQNFVEWDYPPERLEFIIVSDGSTDQTDSILAEASARDARFRIIRASGQGKAAGLNEAVGLAGGEVLLFTDARQLIERNAVALLMENFADPVVGCASGELMLGDVNKGEVSEGLGLYWRIEKRIREMESAGGSVMGATGAFYAVRGDLLIEIPGETILDDVYLPMHIVKAGRRVVFDDRARAWDTPNLGDKREFARKVRTLTGNYQLLQLAPWLLGRTNPARFQFISHKLLRLIVPFALAIVLVAPVFMPGPLYRIALLCQIAFYALSLLALVDLNRGPLQRLGDAALTVVVLNTAAVVAFTNFITGRKVAWAR